MVEMSDRPVTLFRQNGEVWDGTAEVSQRLAMRAEGYGMSSRKLESELERRVQFIDGLVGKGAADYGSMLSDLRRFYGSETLTA